MYMLLAIVIVQMIAQINEVNFSYAFLGVHDRIFVC